MSTAKWIGQIGNQQICEYDEGKKEANQSLLIFQARLITQSLGDESESG
ncbi:MAG: hypothetical protein ABW201_14575 [Candidatus Thiodiazotropha sp.]